MLPRSLRVRSPVRSRRCPATVVLASGQTSPVDCVVRDNHPRGSGGLAGQFAGLGPTCAPFSGVIYETNYPTGGVAAVQRSAVRPLDAERCRLHISNAPLLARLTLPLPSALTAASNFVRRMSTTRSCATAGLPALSTAILLDPGVLERGVEGSQRRRSGSHRSSDLDLHLSCSTSTRKSPAPCACNKGGPISG